MTPKYYELTRALELFRDEPISRFAFGYFTIKFSKGPKSSGDLKSGESEECVVYQNVKYEFRVFFLIHVPILLHCAPGGLQESLAEKSDMKKKTLNTLLGYTCMRLKARVSVGRPCWWSSPDGQTTRVGGLVGALDSVE